jgi:dihydrofolate reductase
MGRKTWESIPEDKRPLQNRINVILSNNPSFMPVNDENNTTLVFNDFETALGQLSEMTNVNEIFVIGGVTLFELSIGKYSNYCKLLFVTRINKAYDCDVFMPKIDESEAGLF